MSETNPVDQDLGKNIKEAIEAENIPHYYTNGFISTLGSGDALLILKQNGNTVATVNLSYTVAKTLAEKLGELLLSFEKKANREIMTIDQANVALEGNTNAPN